MTPKRQAQREKWAKAGLCLDCGGTVEPGQHSHIGKSRRLHTIHTRPESGA